MKRVLLLVCVLCSGCAPPQEPFGVAERFREQIRMVYAEAERVQGVITAAQAGCRAIKDMPEAYWQMDCLTIERASSQLTLVILEKPRWER